MNKPFIIKEVWAEKDEDNSYSVKTLVYNKAVDLEDNSIYHDYYILGHKQLLTGVIDTSLFFALPKDRDYVTKCIETDTVKMEDTDVLLAIQFDTIEVCNLIIKQIELIRKTLEENNDT